MAKREASSTSTKSTPKLVALAERVGHIAGRVQATVDGLRSVRAPKTTSTQKTRTASPGGRSGGEVDAPGKKHRKAPARRRGVKHSEQTVAKIAAQKQARPPRRG